MTVTNSEPTGPSLSDTGQSAVSKRYPDSATRKRKELPCLSKVWERMSFKNDRMHSSGKLQNSIDLEVVPLKGLEPPTPSLRMTCSTS